MNFRIRTLLSLLTVAVLLTAASSAHAVDGQVLITQAKALAGGITPGDAAGFPVTISQPGSYRLSSNLVVPSANTTAIEITTSNVTLDLNGFAILGNADGSNPNCTFDHTGSGIAMVPTSTDRFNITIRNGTIQGMGCHGISLTGGSHLIEHMHIRNVSAGLAHSVNTVGEIASVAQHCTVHRARIQGLGLVSGSIRHNVVTESGLGILGGRGSISYNVVTGNTVGLTMGFFTSYFGNVLGNNTTQTSGGVNLGQNLCDNVACPGAQF